MIAVASVILVITPISWILLHQPQNDQADASIPIVTRTDDTYITPTTKPVVAPPTPTGKPTVPPSATPTPTDSTTPSTTPSTTKPTDRPTASPTQDPTTDPTATPDDRPTTTSPSKPPATQNPPPPPADDGSMTSDELALFTMIDNARQDKGCAPLKRDSNITSGARDTAESNAESGSVNGSNGSMSEAGGDRWSAQDAYNQMMSQSSKTILNCGHKTLGVGYGSSSHCTSLLCPLTGKTPRNAWVADFS
ncbi:CAP domain-containing protein [Kribbella pittospori]|uniref:CAP domain-containing protein n=1 Tax=Kribbella pittospori TaxID=722689 RepID=A0A4R0KUT9_9ACTN|nr:CAP domain-containing protein [Kribbella pittospori]